MTRQLTSNAYNKIKTRLGTKPNNIIEVFGLTFADKTIGDIEAKILELSNLDEVIKLQKSGSTASITVKLDDTDNTLKEILDTRDIHRTPCKVYQTFDGLANTDKFLIFEGVVTSPIIWSESDRTVTFDVLTKMESYEVGFAPIEGQFPNVENYQAWPLGFGNVLHVPAVKINSQLVSSTAGPLVVVDPTLAMKAAILARAMVIFSSSWNSWQQLIAETNTKFRQPKNVIPDLAQTIVYEDSLKQAREDAAMQLAVVQKQLDDFLQAQETEQDVIDLESASSPYRRQVALAQMVLNDITSELVDTLWQKKFLEIEVDTLEFKYQYIGELQSRLATVILNFTRSATQSYVINNIINDQKSYLVSEVGIVNGDKFPQDDTINVLINGLCFEGHFNGKVFKVHQPKATYTNIQITPDPVDKKAFFISDPTINLKGLLCRLEDDRIMEIREQIGNRCTIDPIVSRNNKYNMNSFAKSQDYYANLENYVNKYKPDLFEYTLNYLQGASEFTRNERQRLLLDAINKSYYGPEIERVREIINTMTSSNQTLLEEQNTLDKAIKKNIAYFQSLLDSLILPDDLTREIGRRISDEEYNHLKKLEILQIADDQRSQSPQYPLFLDDIEVYYFDTSTLTKIVEAAPTVLEHWMTPYYSSINTFFSGAVNPDDKIFHLPNTKAFVAQAGSEIKLFQENQNKYVANIIPSEVKAIYGYRNIGGLRQLAPIPETYYTVNESDNYGNITRDDGSTLALNCTTILLHKTLAEYNEGWLGEEIYVSYASSVGPNTVDIIEWLINTYTNLSIDTTSFTYVKNRLINFPSSFALFEKKQVLSLIEDIAWQARCALRISQGIVYITYLAEEPEPVTEINEDDVIEDSLSLTYTETEEIITKFVAKWKRDYSSEKENKTIVRHNIKKYGVLEQEYDFFIYNNLASIEYASTFWSIRLSNTWKLLEFDTFLTTLNLQTQDAVLLNINPNYYGNTAVKCLIDKADYNSESNTISMKVWLPIRSGEMGKYPFAWPADLDIETIYPTVEEIAAGDAGNPINLNVGDDIKYNIDPTNSFFNTVSGQLPRPKDYGRIQISDLAAPIDTAPFSELISIRNPNINLLSYEHDIAPLILAEKDKNKETDPTYKSKTEKRETETEKKIKELQSPSDAPNLTAIGRVKSSLNSDGSLYKVAMADGRELEVTQVIVEKDVILDESTPAYVSFNTNLNRYEMNATPLSSLNSAWRLGLINPGTNLAGTIYLVDTYKTQKIEDISVDTLTGTISAFATSFQQFWPGELVAWVKRSNGEYYIEKLWNTPLKLDQDLLGVRPTFANITASSTVLAYPADVAVNYSQCYKILKAIPLPQSIGVYNEVTNEDTFHYLHKATSSPIIKASNSVFDILSYGNRETCFPYLPVNNTNASIGGASGLFSGATMSFNHETLPTLTTQAHFKIYDYTIFYSATSSPAGLPLTGIYTTSTHTTSAGISLSFYTPSTSDIIKLINGCQHYNRTTAVRLVCYSETGPIRQTVNVNTSTPSIFNSISLLPSSGTVIIIVTGTGDTSPNPSYVPFDL